MNDAVDPCRNFEEIDHEELPGFSSLSPLNLDVTVG